MCLVRIYTPIHPHPQPFITVSGSYISLNKPPHPVRPNCLDQSSGQDNPILNLFNVSQLSRWQLRGGKEWQSTDTPWFSLSLSTRNLNAWMCGCLDRRQPSSSPSSLTNSSQSTYYSVSTNSRFPPQCLESLPEVPDRAPGASLARSLRSPLPSAPPKSLGPRSPHLEV